MALSNAERQKRYRQKLQEAFKTSRYEPKQYIAYGVRELKKTGIISEELCMKIIQEGLTIAKDTINNFNPIDRQLIEKNINDFFE